MSKIFYLLLFCVFPLPVMASAGIVVRILDGDTVHIKSLSTGEVQNIRLYGIDAPEKRGIMWKEQPGADIAYEALSLILPEGAMCEVIQMEKDKYGRIVADVYTEKGENVQEKLILFGMAWVYQEYCYECKDWISLEENARTRKIGIWGDTNPIPPWEWRRSKK